MKIENIKDLIQSCNINFLIGSGLSNPYLSTLGNIEKLLTEVNNNKPEKIIYEIIKASIYKTYFEHVISRNLKPEIDINKDVFTNVLDDYKNILLSINEILLYRHNNLLTKQVNLFSTNIDLFMEKALEETGLEFNDGFKGRLNPTYDLSNFQKSYSKTSSHYDNVSEIPVFNLLKVHGSINWKKNKDDMIVHSSFLSQVKKIKEELKEIPNTSFLNFSDKTTYPELFEQAVKKEETINYKKFLDEYDKLLIINPTKEKFQRTVFDEQFYELLRIYANILEKENSLLFVMGFSFADQHIKHITIRAADSNPTLQIIIFAYEANDVNKIKKELGRFKNNNIYVMDSELFIKDNQEKNEEKIIKEGNKILKDRLKNFDCKSINQEVFSKIKEMIRLNSK